MKKIFYIFVLSAMSINVYSQVGIGTKTPDPSSILDLNVDNLPVSNKKGFLAPKVALSSNKDITTIPNPATGLLVYNLGTGALKIKGYFFWDGTEWLSIDNSTANSAEIGSLLCGTAVLEPANYTSGNYYKGNLKVQYTSGNGGSYQTGDSLVVNGLVVKLRSGKLEYGSGTFVFSVEGTPTVSSPITTTIPIQGATGNKLVPFLSAAMSCNAIVGDQVMAETKTSTSIGPLFSTSDPEAGYHRIITSPDGKYSVRVVINNNNSFSNSDLQIRSNIGTPTIMWNGGLMWVNGAGAHGNNGTTFPAQGVWYGNGGGSGTTFSSGITSAWGDPDVYFGSPEWRRYTWTSTLDSDKTVYILEFFMGSSNPSLIANTTNCPSGICNNTKVYLKLIEVVAP